MSSSIDDAHLKRCLDIFSMSEMYTIFDVRMLHPYALFILPLPSLLCILNMIRRRWEV